MKRKPKKLPEPEIIDVDRMKISKSGKMYHVNPPIGFVKRHIVLTQIPKTEKEQNELGHEAVEFALQESTIALADFPVSKLMSPYKFFKLCENNTYFAECIDIANGIISARLRKVAYVENPDSYVWKMLPIHDRKFKESIMEMRGNDKVQQANEQKIVVIERFPESSLVPKKNDESCNSNSIE